VLVCQAQQTWNGPHKLEHLHRWQDKARFGRVVVTWTGGGS
jgi:hypothetical protein